jgi:hypothetical protein
VTHLALNTTISQSLRARYLFGIAALPIGLMFLSFAPLWVFANWMAATLGIHPDGAVKEHPNAWTWFTILMVAMIALMLAGYALGWALNVLLSRHIFGWNEETIRAVYGRSQVPSHWLKQGALPPIGETPQILDAWEIQRKSGLARFIMLRGVLSWGAPMFIAMYVAPAAFGSRQINVETVLFNLALWGSAGAAFGASIWFLSEYNHRKRKRAPESEA